MKLIMLSASLGLLGIGFWMAYQPLGLIVPGALLFAGLWRGAK